jgi:uncharacterized protein with von Willebrand factor type A (vWA) domain
MPHFRSSSRYSEWDGTQGYQRPDAEEILSALSDDMMEFGDLRQAMRYLARNGMHFSDDGYIRGLRDMLKQLRDKRREQLNRYDIAGVMDDIKRQLDEILALEQDTIDDWKKRNQAKPPSDPDGDRSSADSSEDAPETQFSDRVLGDIGEQNQKILDELPQDTAGRVRTLERYEFLNPDAQRKFLKLLEQLKQAMTQSFFSDMQKMVEQMSDSDLQRMKDMVKDLNEMLVKKIAGEDPGFESFMQKYGDMFGDNPPASLDELLDQIQRQMAASQSMLNSMSPEQRDQLQSMMSDRFCDPELESELAKLAKEMAFLNPQGNQYSFRGDEGLDLQSAMDLMGDMQKMDELEIEIQQAQLNGDVSEIDPSKLEEVLGEDSRKELEEIEKLLSTLEEAGYARRDGEKWKLTPRGTRTLAQKALSEIYTRLKKQSLGNHTIPEEGRFGDRMEDTKPYEFGDPFHLHMSRTLRNALDRNGPQTPVKLTMDDFEIYRSELITQTSTVLMVDLSWSMAMRGSFQAAKKVTMALHNLISTSYPRDSLYILGFSAYAREIKSHDLAYLQYDDYLLGTNMQHAMMLAEKLLARHSQGSKQIIMITDGEPTSHMENNEPVFAYPPTPTTIRKTLNAVKSCTRKNITINTFMLEQSEYLQMFVEQMTKINGGRVFYSTPENLGEYLLVDYVQHKRKQINRR